jgi:ABC-type transport system involved in multi-copper enzyme maturation permease subunit
VITLIQKDLRQTAWPMALAWLALFAPVLVWLSVVAAERSPFPGWEVSRSQVTSAMLLGTFASLIAASSITGVAFAKERRERTAELLRTLPVSNWKIVMSKAVVAAVVTAGPLAVGTAAFMLLAERDEFQAVWMPFDELWMVVSAWLLLFGLGWALSSVLKSEVLSTSMPIVVLIVLGAMISLRASTFERELVHSLFARYRAQSEFITVAGSIGLLSLIGGTVVSLRRKSP